MSLKALMIKKRLDQKRAELAKLREEQEAFATRETELAGMIAEASTEEEQGAVEEAVAAFEAEKADNAEKTGNIEKEIADIEKELEEEEGKQEEARSKNPKPEQKREVVNIMNKRFRDMNIMERHALFEREEVKNWLSQIRQAGKEKRAINGGNLLIPEIVLNLILSDVTEYSLLYKHVRVVPVSGTTRQNIMGDIPEGVWTEMCKVINEVSIGFTDVEVDGYKVASFIPVCNALLDDSDINLGAAIIDALGRGLGLALDKAIIAGTGVKMPTGIFGQLASSNKITITTANATGIKLFQEIINASGKCKHAAGQMFWAMNHTTYTKILAESVGTNAAASIVAGMSKQMPVIGGAIEELDFMPDNVIIGGFGQRYLLAQRAGITVDYSEHVQFIQDNTVFRARGRYDGKPVFADSFVAIGLGAAPSVNAITFAADTANAGA